MTQEQMKELEILREFQRVCQKYNLKYYAIGGTCLGAVRHKGFIPWDDDIDVAMPVEDYHEFFEVAPKELNSQYEVIGPYTMRHTYGLYNKIHDKETTFVETSVKKYLDRYTGIFIDIFPISGLPKQESARKKMIDKIALYDKLGPKLRFPFEECASIKSKIAWMFCIPDRVLRRDYWYYTDKQWELIDRYLYEESDKVLFPWREKPSKRKTYKNVFYREDFTTPQEVPFEDGTISIPNGYKRYLTMDFGDYMELPPVEKRKTEHDPFIIDCTRPCSYYVEKYKSEGIEK